MNIPRYDEIMVPALELLKDGSELKLREFEQPLAKVIGLTDEEVAHEYESGNDRMFIDRASWALSYLFMSGLVERPKRGVYRITDKGKDKLRQPDKVKPYVQEAIAKREAEKTKNKGGEEVPESKQTPEESLYNSFDGIKSSIYAEIISTINSKAPREFEKLVVMLLQKMGYGGEVHNSGEVTKQSNDGGIDGIIKEDVLGLGRIHIQAKRYAPDNSVGREEIQKFVGALAVAQSNKGVFITTSYFSKGALTYCENLNATTTIVLIDGKRLAELMYEYGLGMQTEKTIEIKKLDSDFWDALLDDDNSK